MSSPGILDEILAAKREEAGRLLAFRDALAAAAGDAPPPRGFEAALRSAGEVSVIAEFKRRSPSAGEIQPYAQVGGVARVYEEAGARAVSVLTDGPWFGGSLDDLRQARTAVSVPLLRKDFIVDAVQLYEARAAGADAILLIARALAGGALEDLIGLADELGMAALVETHGEEDLERVLETDARIVGVNARDLATFEVDLDRALAAIDGIPADRIAVAESGIGGAEDVARAGRSGADAVLVGGWLMKHDPFSGVEALVGHARRPRGEGEPGGRRATAGAEAAEEVP